MTEPAHGHHGWQLVDYEWDEDTGNARFTYRRGQTSERKIVNKPQLKHYTKPEDRFDPATDRWDWDWASY